MMFKVFSNAYSFDEFVFSLSMISADVFLTFPMLILFKQFIAFSAATLSVT